MLRPGSELLRGPCSRLGKGAAQAVLRAIAGPGSLHANQVQFEANLATNLWSVFTQAALDDLSYFADSGHQLREVMTNIQGDVSPIELLASRLTPCVQADPSSPPPFNLYLPSEG